MFYPSVCFQCASKVVVPEFSLEFERRVEARCLTLSKRVFVEVSGLISEWSRRYSPLSTVPPP